MGFAPLGGGYAEAAAFLMQVLLASQIGLLAYKIAILGLKIGFFGASSVEAAFLERFFAIFCIFVLIFGGFGKGLGMIFGRFFRMFVKNAIL